MKSLYLLIAFCTFCLEGNLYIRNEFGTNDSVALYGSLKRGSSFHLYGMGQYAFPLNREYPKSKRRMGELYLGAGYCFHPFGTSLNTLVLAGWEHSPYENSFYRVVPGVSLSGCFGEVQLYGYVPLSHKKEIKGRFPKGKLWLEDEALYSCCFCNDEVAQYGVDGFYQYTFSKLCYSTVRLGGFGYFKRGKATSYGGVRAELIIPMRIGFFQTRHEYDSVFGYLVQVGLSIDFGHTCCCPRPSVPEPTLWFRTRRIKEKKHEFCVM